MQDRSRHYEVLEIEPGASKDEVRRAYRELAQVWHPDRFHGRPDLRLKAEERFQKINDAYRELMRGEFGSGQTDAEGEKARRGSPSGGGTGTKAGGNAGRLFPVRRWCSRMGAWGRFRPDRRWLRFGAIVLVPFGFGIAMIWLISGPAFVARDGETVRFVEVSAGGRHACALDSAGTVYCWGADDSHQLGNGEGSDVCREDATLPCSSRPRGIRLPVRFVSVAAGWSHTCAVSDRGEAYCWGAGFAGQTGIGRANDQPEPTRVESPPLQAVTTLGQHTCALSDEGSVFCWGSDESGQLGDAGTGATCIADSGTFPCSLTPVKVDNGQVWTVVSAGGSHTCGIAETGRAFCWGSNRSGQLGTPGGTRCGSPGSEHLCRRVPELVSLEVPLRHISAGAAHTCALTAAGMAWCWGDNRYGQLGDATVESSSAPVRVAGNHVFESIEARAHQTCAVGNNGRVFCWGRVPAGIGNAKNMCAGVRCMLVPTLLAFPANTRVAAGIEFACVLAQKTQRCWGRNDVGQLGNGRFRTLALSTTPSLAEDNSARPGWTPLRGFRNLVNSAVWALRRFANRLLAPVVNELNRR